MTCIIRLKLSIKECSGRSLTYTVSGKEPRTEPCGTPEETIALEERQKILKHLKMINIVIYGIKKQGMVVELYSGSSLTLHI